MNEFLKMDIFFVVATIGAVTLVVLLGIAVFYIIRLLRTLNRVADTVEEEADVLKKDIHEVRASIKHGGKGLLSIFGFGGKKKKRLPSKKRKSS
jgi:uncharacterized protein YoxC